MLCDSCKKNEATVHTVTIINGMKQEHYLCPECAMDLRVLDTGMTPEWSSAIFRLLSDTPGQKNGRKPQTVYDEKLKTMECPTCHKRYGDFLEDGQFGCADCYDAFSPFMDQMILSIQGADSHTGKRPASLRLKTPEQKKQGDIAEEMLTPEEETEMLKIRLQEAVYAEDYETAAKLRDQIKALSKELKA